MFEAFNHSFKILGYHGRFALVKFYARQLITAFQIQVVEINKGMDVVRDSLLACQFVRF